MPKGQRRYVETFSPYARQFLDRMDKPQVDRIEGIPPAIAIDQTNPVRTSRSTVGTMTELNDHLKLLFARAAIASLPRVAVESVQPRHGGRRSRTAIRGIRAARTVRRSSVAAHLPGERFGDNFYRIRNQTVTGAPGIHPHPREARPHSAGDSGPVSYVCRRWKPRAPAMRSKPRSR